MSEWLTRAFLQMISMTVSAGWTILLIIAARLILYRFPKRNIYPLWIAAAFRLCCPFSLHSLYSLFPPALETPVNFIVQIPMNGIAGNDFAQPVVDGIPYSPAGWNWMPFLAGIWAAGVCLLLGWGIFKTWKLNRYLRSLKPAGIRGVTIPVAYLPEGVHSTFLFGLFKPCIYLPKGLSEKETKYIIAHELSHFRRGDYIAKPFFWVLTCIHWINPLVWLAFYLFEMDMEKSCDERVILQMSESPQFGISLTDVKKEYSSVLLGMSSKRRFSAGPPLALGENGVKGRIRGILRYRKTKLWVSMIAILIVAAVFAGLILNPADNEGRSGNSDVTITLLAQNEDGKNYSVSLALPDGMSAAETATGEGSELPLPSFVIQQNGETVGTLTFFPFATDNPDDLQSVDTASESLPMQVYATIALANHADYHNGYEVVSSTDTACTAICRPLIQDIENYAGHTPDAPWTEYDGILAYDLSGEPYFLSMVFNADLISHQQLIDLAKSISFSYK